MYERLEDTLRILAIAFIVILVLWLVTAVTAYVLNGIALYRMARNAGLPSPGLAWVPVANHYLLGALCERSTYFNTGKEWKFSVILPIADLLSVFGGNAIAGLASAFANSFYLGYGYNSFDFDLWPMLGNLISLAFVAVMAVALYQLYRDYVPGQEVLYTVLSVIFGGLGRAVLLMVIRDRVPVSAQYQSWGPPPGGYPPQGPPYQAPPYCGPQDQGGWQNGAGGAGWGQPPYQGGGSDGESWGPPPGGNP